MLSVYELIINLLLTIKQHEKLIRDEYIKPEGLKPTCLF